MAREEEIIQELNTIRRQNDKLIALLENIYRIIRESYLRS